MAPTVFDLEPLIKKGYYNGDKHIKVPVPTHPK